MNHIINHTMISKKSIGFQNKRNGYALTLLFLVLFSVGFAAATYIWNLAPHAPSERDMWEDLENLRTSLFIYNRMHKKVPTDFDFFIIDASGKGWIGPKYTKIISVCRFDSDD